MTSEIQSILKTCSICKETFATLRDLIQHENAHRHVALLIPNTSMIRVPNSTSTSSSSTTTLKVVLLRDGQSISSSNAVQHLSESEEDQKVEKGPEEFRNAITSDPLDNSSELFAEADTSSDDEQNGAEHFCDSQSTLAFFYRFSSPNRLGQSEQQLHLVRGSYGTVHFRVEFGDRDGKMLEEYHAPSSRWLCEYCLGTFSVSLPPVCHRSRFHYSADGELIYYCFKCSYNRRGRIEKTYFGSEDQFRTHLAIKHGITIVKEADNDGQPAGAEIENDGRVAPWNCQSAGTSKDIMDSEASSSKTPSSASADMANGGDHDYVSFLEPLEKKKKRIRYRPAVTCKYCLGSFTRSEGLRVHQQRLHCLDARNPTYFCGICSGKGSRDRIYFSDKKEFQRHAKETHGYAIEDDKSDTNRQFGSSASSTSVDSGSSSTSATPRGTAASSKIPSTQKRKPSKELQPRYVCKYCLGIFRNRKYLEQHQTDLHYVANGNVRYYCSTCTGGPGVRYRLYFQNEETFRTHIVEKHGIIDAGSGSSEEAAASARVRKEKAIKKFPRKLEAGDQKNDDFKKMKVDDCSKAVYSGDFGMPAASDPRACGKSGVPDSEMGASAWTSVVKTEPVESDTANIGHESVLPDSVTVKIELMDAS